MPNETYTPSQMAAAIASIGQAALQTKTATQNGTVTPDTGYDGLSSVTVNVSGNPNYVETISGTILNPWGGKFAAIMQEYNAGNCDLFLRWGSHNGLKPFPFQNSRISFVNYATDIDAQRLIDYDPEEDQEPYLWYDNNFSVEIIEYNLSNGALYSANASGDPIGRKRWMQLNINAATTLTIIHHPLPSA